MAKFVKKLETSGDYLIIVELNWKTGCHKLQEWSFLFLNI